MQKFDSIKIRAFRIFALVHLIAMLPLPACLTIFLLIASPSPCCPSVPLTPLQSTLKMTWYPDATVPEVPSHMVSAEFRCGSYCTNVEGAEREFAQPRLRLSVLFVSCGRPASFLDFPVAFSEQMPSAFHSVQGVYHDYSLDCSDVSGKALPPRLDFTSVDTFAYSRVTSEHLYSLRFGSHVFRGGGLPSTVATGNEFASLVCISTCRCCRHTCTVSIDESSHEPTSCRGTN